MRYAPTHKLATRRRIVEAASQAFRERGVGATGVDEVMRRAGLTHGGFYAHFRDKAELVTEACANGFDAAVGNLGRIAALPTVRARVRALILTYLGSHHRDNPADGCLLAALGGEASRLDERSRALFSASFQCHRERVAAALAMHPDPQENERLVTALLGMLVGGLVLARSLADESASADVLSQVRRTALEFFA